MTVASKGAATSIGTDAQLEFVRHFNVERTPLAVFAEGLGHFAMIDSAGDVTAFRLARTTSAARRLVQRVAK